MMSATKIKGKFVYALICSLFLVCLVREGECYSSNVPPTRSVCREMKPGHQRNIRSDPAPFTVTPNINTVQGGEDVIVTLSGDSGNKFLGFYLQARDENSTPIGTFLATPDAKVHNCGPARNNAAFHGNGKIEKENITVTWKAPKSFQGPVEFLASFVKEFDTFWTKVKGAETVTVTPDTK